MSGPNVRTSVAPTPGYDVIMKDADRFRLLGTYRTPRFRIGQRVRCQVRGEVVITGISAGPIAWPIGRGGRGRHSLVVFKGLARAVRREANQAVAHWFGVDPQTVSKWRRMLSVPRATPGTSRLHRLTANTPAVIEGLRKATAKAGDPERCRKIADAKRGKPRPPHVAEAVRAAHTGTRHTEESRRRMSEAHRRRGTLPPGTVVWTPEEDERVRKLPAEEAARRTGRSLSAVYARLRRL